MEAVFVDGAGEREFAEDMLVAKDSVTVVRECIIMAKQFGKRQGEAKATHGCNIKPKCFTSKLVVVRTAVL